MKRISVFRQYPAALLAAFLTALIAGCGGTTAGNPLMATEDTSASGAAAAAAGGALSASSSSGTQARFVPTGAGRLLAFLGGAIDFLPDALAAALCPTFRTAQGAGCSANGAGGAMWLSYAGCSFSTSSSAATWSGTKAFFMSAGSASCGTFPAPGPSQNLVMQYVSGTSSTTPGTVTITSSFGTQAVVDNASAYLHNFDNDHTSLFAFILNNGYGTKVSYDASGLRNQLVIGQRMYSSTPGGFDHSVVGTLNIAETSTSRTISGSVYVYHNALQVVGKSTFNNVVHTDGCCFPTSGSVTTAFNQGTNVLPTAAGSKFVGKSETLTFTGCGTGTLVGTDGATTAVTLSRCF